MGVAEKEPPQQQQTTQGEQAATSEQQAAMPAEHSDAAERIVIVPFDAKNTRTWFAPARLAIDDMRKRGAKPAEFKAFRAQHEPALTALNDEYRSWYKILDGLLAKGEAGA
jgi:hypothetical protein